MSKEELEAIEKVREVIKTDKQRRIGTIYDEKPLFRDQLQTLVDLIEKQQKEIEENQVFIDDIKDHRIVYIDTPEFEEKFISKDKIREKIDELKKQDELSELSHNYLIIEVLQELLEEK